MTGSAPLQVGAIAAVYLLWFVGWFVLGHEAVGPAYYNGDDTLVATVAAVRTTLGTIEYAAPSLEAENSSGHTGRVKGFKKLTGA
jgi:hypothetical protein